MRAAGSANSYTRGEWQKNSYMDAMLKIYKFDGVTYYNGNKRIAKERFSKSY